MAIKIGNVYFIISMLIKFKKTAINQLSQT